MERKHICIDCGKEFIINSSKNTHAKRCPLCREFHNRTYQRMWKANKRLLDPNYSAKTRINWIRKKFLENPILFYRHRMFIAAKSRALQENLPFNIKEEDIKDFHTKMWIFCHGIATLVANDTIKLTDNQIQDLLSCEFQALMLLEENPNNKWVLPKKEENK